METTTVIAPKGWWASKSTGAKWGIGITLALATLGIGYAVYHFAFKEKDEPKKITPPANVSEDQEAKEVAKPHTETSDLTLPNKGVGCSPVVTNYDRDYDYVKCGGVWYIKSKPNASTEAAKNSNPNWTSLSKNVVTTKLLDTRYKNF